MFQRVGHGDVEVVVSLLRRQRYHVELGVNVHHATLKSNSNSNLRRIGAQFKHVRTSASTTGKADTRLSKNRFKASIKHVSGVT